MIYINLLIKNNDICVAYQLWSNMSKLDNLYLLGNSLNGMKIIPFLIIAPSLKTLDLSDNNMEGSLSFKGELFIFKKKTIYI